MEAPTMMAIATITAAVITCAVATYNVYKTNEIARLTREANEILQIQTAQIKGKVDQATHIINANYSKRVETLAEIYSQLVGVKLQLESFVVPYFTHSTPGNQADLLKAADNFLDLYKYSSQKSVYLPRHSLVMTTLAKMLGNINAMINASSTPNSWNQTATLMINDINPLLDELGDEVKAALNL